MHVCLTTCAEIRKHGYDSESDRDIHLDVHTIDEDHMPRSTVLFGNGLGVAIDQRYFRLESGLQWVWNKSDYVTADQKRLVASAIRLRRDEYPKSEEQLDQVQVAIAASNFLRSFESKEWGVKWLSDESRDFPDAFRRFVHEVAWYFHNYRKQIPEDFGNSLSNFVKSTNHMLRHLIMITFCTIRSRQLTFFMGLICF